MVIDVIDMTDGSGQYVKEYLERAGYKHFVELWGMSGALQVLADRIMTVAPLFTIKVLRVWGHGSAGSQNIAAGRCAGGSHGSAITLGALNTLADLGKYFAPGARVELRGCSVADDGGKLIGALAQLWYTRVQAARGAQQGLFEWVGVVEARPGFSGLYPVTPVPIERGD